MLDRGTETTHRAAAESSSDSMRVFARQLLQLYCMHATAAQMAVRFAGQVYWQLSGDFQSARETSVLIVHQCQHCD
jgi:hypothetical protein